MLLLFDTSAVFMHFVSPVLNIRFRPAVPTHCGWLQLWKQELLSQHTDETLTLFSHISGETAAARRLAATYILEKKMST